MSEIIKITFENIETGANATFYTTALDVILSSEYFTQKIIDAKTNEEYSIGEKIIEQLKKTIQ